MAQNKNRWILGDNIEVQLGFGYEGTLFGEEQIPAKVSSIRARITTKPPEEPHEMDIYIEDQKTVDTILDFIKYAMKNKEEK